MAVLRKFLVIAILCYTTNQIAGELTAEPPQCIHQGEELWPHVNPNFYWYCEDLGAEPKHMICPEGRGFLRIENEVSGCVPFDSWKCTSKVGKPSCVGDEIYKPHKHENPNKFWACTEPEPGKPSYAVEADCLDFPTNGDPPKKGNRGFVDNVENLGCVPWDVWVCVEPNDKTRE